MIFLSWQLKVLQTWQNWLLNQSKGREWSFLAYTCNVIYSRVLQGKKGKAWAVGKENPARKKKGYLGISFSITSYSMFALLFFSISYFFLGSVPSPADPPKSPMPLSCIARVALRLRQLQNIKGKKRVSLNAIIIFKEGNWCRLKQQLWSPIIPHFIQVSKIGIIITNIEKRI